ncbi:MAG: Asp-tRNA(Asn)/Glu-tRNA(Gln) amidotransferase subunit GatA [Nitrospirae bacterium]|nr:Asp-tRNA(Asn)/Glu-tRNA(Gln) amidotransferase subunit GatA [Nitrospirota bacterium]
MNLAQFTIHELHEQLKNRKTTSGELTRSVLQRIEAVESRIHAFTTVTAELALAQAEAADRWLRSGRPVHPLTGIPIALKDNLCTKGVRTTCASRILENFVPPYDATVVGRLKESGAVFIGKTNMDEFAMGSSTENSAWGLTANPWDLNRIPGGSSGGSAAAVAADACIAALGSDTGGSIRQPAAMCGVVGLKPTYGRVSRYGLVAFASSLDQIGPLTKDVTDCAILMKSISGSDSFDSTSADVPVENYTGLLNRDLSGLQIGIPKEYFIDGMDPEVLHAVKEAVRTMEKLGAKTREVLLPHTEYAIATYYILATAEASSNLARYDGVKYGSRAKPTKDLLEMYMKTRQAGFGPEVKRRIMLGTYALSSGYYDAYYRKAQCVRTLIKNDFDEAFKQVDVIVTPTAPSAAFKIGEKTKDPLQMYLSDIFTISVNIVGIPAVSMPCGFTQTGLPIGLQIMGRPFAEATVLNAAYAYEQATEWRKKKPNL